MLIDQAVMTNPARGKTWWWLVPLLLIVAWLASIRMTVDLFWIDEQLTRYLAIIDDTGGPIPYHVIAFRVKGDTWPPLYYFTLATWARLMGPSDFSLRLLSFFCGILTLPLVYRLGRDVISPRVGLLAAVVLGSSAFFIHYLHEARAYTLYTLFTVLCVWLYWRLLNNPRSNTIPMRLLFVGSIAALLYLHYIAPITCIALGLYHLFLAPKRNGRWWVIARQFVYGGLLFIPWASIALSTASSEGEAARGLSTQGIIQMTLIDFSNFLPLFLLVVVGLSLVRIRQRGVLFLWWWLALAFILALLLNSVLQFLFSARHIMMILVALCLLMAVTMAHLLKTSRWVGAGALGLWILLGISGYISPRYFGDTPAGTLRKEWDTAAAVISECVSPDDVVVFHFDVSLDGSYRDLPEQVYARNEWRHEIPLNPYYRGTGTTTPYAQLMRMQDLFFSPVVFDAITDPPYEERLNTFINDAARVWVFASPGMPAYEHRTQFDAFVEARYPLCGRVADSRAIAIDVYSKSPLNCINPQLTTPELGQCASTTLEAP